MSENLVVNITLSGETKNCLVKDENDNILINEQIFNFFFPKVSTLVLSPVIVNSRSIEPQVVKAVQILESWRATNPQLPILLFPNNPLTPLTATKVFFQKTTKDIEIYQQLLNIYPEEQNTLELCFRLAPSYLVSPTNFYNL
ncbi:MAG: hypothetical protein RML72_06855 [Bacteroidia bacterium]|nr:hypothetical protein [Bacteroidia bacterium]